MSHKNKKTENIFFRSLFLVFCGNKSHFYAQKAGFQKPHTADACQASVVNPETYIQLLKKLSTYNFTATGNKYWNPLFALNFFRV
jgi:hypothetical protein